MPFVVLGTCKIILLSFCTAGRPVLQHEAQQRPPGKPTVLEFCYQAGPTLTHHIVRFAQGWQWRKKCQERIAETLYRGECVGDISSDFLAPFEDYSPWPHAKLEQGVIRMGAQGWESPVVIWGIRNRVV